MKRSSRSMAASVLARRNCQSGVARPVLSRLLSTGSASDGAFVQFVNAKGSMSLRQQVRPSDLLLKNIHPENFAAIPTLSHGLDRVLFNPGVHYLRDFRTNVYNFDPALRNICHPDEFNFDSIPQFVPPSQDAHLQATAVRTNSKFVSSTSSIAPSMSQLYFLISNMRPMNLSARFTGAFEDEPQTFTLMTRSPIGVYLRPHRTNGGTSTVRSLVCEKAGNEDDKPTILMQLGNVLEKLLTHSSTDFKRMMKGAANPYVPKTGETYNYLQASSLLLRSQLDCHDHRLPKKSFDLKTRATLPIRMDVKNYRDYLSYRLHRTLGLYESFEREFFDLCRSALLKYNFQVRIGDMDGILVAYHNTAELFGFQYLTRADMDEILFGNSVAGDAVFRVVLRVYEQLLHAIVSLYRSEDIVRLTFSLSKDASKLAIFSEAVTEDGANCASNGSGTPDFHQFLLTATNNINGFRAENTTLDPSGLDDWRLDYCLAQQRPNTAEYESARRRASEGRIRDSVDSTDSRVSLPIMRNARRVYPSAGFESTVGPDILAPWTKM